MNSVARRVWGSRGGGFPETSEFRRVNGEWARWPTEQDDADLARRRRRDPKIGGAFVVQLRSRTAG